MDIARAVFVPLYIIVLVVIVQYACPSKCLDNSYVLSFQKHILFFIILMLFEAASFVFFFVFFLNIFIPVNTVRVTFFQEVLIPVNIVRVPFVQEVFVPVLSE